MRHFINGQVFGNLRLDALSMKKGERVRWYLMGGGNSLFHCHVHDQLSAGMSVRYRVG